jgi:hypothetical protein
LKNNDRKAIKQPYALFGSIIDPTMPALNIIELVLTQELDLKNLKKDNFIV